MDALTQDNNSVHTIKRPTNMYRPIPDRWRYVLSLHLAGFDDTVIAQRTGYTENSIWRILNNENVDYVRQQLLANVQKEFEAKFSKVVKTIDKGLEDDDPKVRAIYTRQWLQAHGKFQPERGSTNVNVTAEDVVFQMLNGDINASQQ